MNEPRDTTMNDIIGGIKMAKHVLSAAAAAFLKELQEEFSHIRN